MKITRAALLGTALILWTGTSMAAENCSQVRIAMTQFRPAEYSAPVIWKTPVGERAIENLQDAVFLDDQSVIAGGFFAPAAEAGKVQPYLMRMERRGKILWEVRTEAKTPQKITSVVRDEKGISALVSVLGDGDALRRVDVVQYDLDGKRLGGFSLSERDGHLDPVAIVSNKEGYYVAARYANKKVLSQHFGVIYKTDKTGKRIWRRAYIPGLVTSLEDMLLLKNGDLLLAGAMTSDAGEESGWLVRTDHAGGIKWQKNYPRGRASQATSVSEIPNGSGYLVGGVSWPIGGERTGAWIMKIEIDGDMVWERFYTGADDYRTLDVSSLEDGRSVAMMSALSKGMPEDGNYAHARLLALSPRGELLEADSFTDGTGLWPSRLLNAGGQPILIGSIREVPPDPAVDKDKKPLPPPPVSYDGWVGEIQTFSFYDDPCQSDE